MNKKLFTYKKSGVNIDAADSFVNFISSVSSKKKGKKKFSNIGGFGSISDIPNHIKNQSGDTVICYDVEFKKWEDLQIDTIQSFKVVE